MLISTVIMGYAKLYKGGLSTASSPSTLFHPWNCKELEKFKVYYVFNITSSNERSLMAPSSSSLAPLFEGLHPIRLPLRSINSLSMRVWYPILVGENNWTPCERNGEAYKGKPKNLDGKRVSESPKRTISRWAPIPLCNSKTLVLKPWGEARYNLFSSCNHMVLTSFDHSRIYETRVHERPLQTCKYFTRHHVNQ